VSKKNQISQISQKINSSGWFGSGDGSIPSLVDATDGAKSSTGLNSFVTYFGYAQMPVGPQNALREIAGGRSATFRRSEAVNILLIQRL
jgi:hypothetical protein